MKSTAFPNIFPKKIDLKCLRIAGIKIRQGFLLGEGNAIIQYIGG
jgi:hypothetical protein